MCQRSASCKRIETTLSVFYVNMSEKGYLGALDDLAWHWPHPWEAQHGALTAGWHLQRQEIGTWQGQLAMAEDDGTEATHPALDMFKLDIF